MALMEVTVNTKILKVEFARDFTALSITKQTDVIIAGATYKGTVQKSVINKHDRNELNELITNPDFNAQVDAFTGITNFIATYLPL
jgi:hypothetical protein